MAVRKKEEDEGITEETFKDIKYDLPTEVISKIINLDNIKVEPTYVKSYAPELEDFMRLLCVKLYFKDNSEIELGRGEFIELISTAADRKINDKEDFLKAYTLLRL